MGTFFYGISMMFPRLLDHSVEISILICLIFFVKLVAPKKLPPWWHYCLWLMLLIRMLLPLEFENRLNVFNFVPIHTTPQVSEIILDSPNEIPNDLLLVAPEESDPGPDIQIRVKKAIPVVWLAGAMILGVCILFESVSFWLKIRRKPRVTNKAVLALLSECKSRMNIKTNINVVVTETVRSPALFGYLRPRLLLPEGIFEKLSERELRYAFMHELGHLKRHDVGVSWLIAVLQVVHWFNPLVWLAFYQIRIDQESACDAAVLSRMAPKHSSDYAKAIVGFLEKFCHNCQLPGLAGILENRAQMRKRISKIVHYRKSSQKLSLAAATLLVFSGCLLFSLTGVAAQKRESGSLNLPLEMASLEDIQAIPEGRPIEAESVPIGLRPDAVQTTYRLEPEGGLPSETLSENPPAIVSRASIMPQRIDTDANTLPVSNVEAGFAGSPKNEGTNKTYLVLTDPPASRRSAISGVARTATLIPVAVENNLPTQPSSNISTSGEDSSGQVFKEQKFTDGITSGQMVNNQRRASSAEKPMSFSAVVVREGNTKPEYQPGVHPGIMAEDNHQKDQSSASFLPNYFQSEQNRLADVVIAENNQLIEKSPGKMLQEIPLVASMNIDGDTAGNRGAFHASEVDTPPRLIKAYPPHYPYLAKRDDITGYITLQFVVTKEGNAVNTMVLQSSPAGVFDEAALHAIEKYRFKPGVKDGKAVDVKVNLPIKFNLT